MNFRLEEITIGVVYSLIELRPKLYQYMSPKLYKSWLWPVVYNVFFEYVFIDF